MLFKIIKNRKNLLNIAKKYLMYKFKFWKIYNYVLNPILAYKRIKKATKLIDFNFDNTDLISKLNLDGYSTAPEKFIDQSILGELTTIVERKISESGNIFELGEKNNESSKKYFRQLLTSEDLQSNSKFVKYALQDKFIALAGDYLGQIPCLSRIDCILSLGLEENEFSASQNWHRDWDDSKMLKFITYFSDVNSEDDGPFTLIPKNVSQEMNLRLIPLHKSSDELNKTGVQYNSVKLYGNKKSTFMVDTNACLHRGSRFKKGNYRIALIITFNTSSRLHPYKSQIQINNPITDLHRLVLEC